MLYHHAMRITTVVAIGLMVLPEPVTTVIGLGMLAGVRYVSKKRSAGVMKRFEPMLRECIECSRRNKIGIPQPTLQQSLRMSLVEEKRVVADWQKMPVYASVQNDAQSHRSSPARVIHHSLIDKFPETGKPETKATSPGIYGNGISRQEMTGRMNGVPQFEPSERKAWLCSRQLVCRL